MKLRIRSWSGALLIAASSAMAACAHDPAPSARFGSDGTAVELRANQPATFVIDGVEIARGRFAEAKLRGKGAVAVVARAEGYREKTEYVTPPFDDKKISFVFEVGDRLDGRDSWGRKVDDGRAAGASQPAAPPPGAATPEPLKIPVTIHTAPSDARFAIVVGIETYANGLPKADGAVRDAVTFAAVAGDALGVPQSHVVVLTNERATRTGIEARLKEWLPRVMSGTSDPEVYFFFAGHGAPDPTTGDAYLVPWDADPKYLRTQGLRVSELHSALAASGARSVFAFLDSCFSGSGGRSVLAAGTRPLVRVKEENFAAPPPAPGAGGARVYASLAAAAGNEITGRAREADAGLFTYHLTTGLGGAADRDKDGRVALGELYDYVREHVEKDARLDNRDQTPQLSVSTGDKGAIVVGKREVSR